MEASIAIEFFFSLEHLDASSFYRLTVSLIQAIRLLIFCLNRWKTHGVTIVKLMSTELLTLFRTVHTNVDSFGNYEENARPLISALMVNRRPGLYEKTFATIEELVPKLLPDELLSDFVTGLQNARQTFFNCLRTVFERKKEDEQCPSMFPRSTQSRENQDCAPHLL